MSSYTTVKQTAEKYRFISESGIRWHIFRDTNGFNKCLRKIGRKILIDEVAFLAWVDSQKAA